MENINYISTKITGGFWKNKIDLVRNVTVKAVYDRFKKSGRFDAVCFNWNGDKENEPHPYFDSDVAKWIEGVAYLTAQKREPELEKIADETIDCIEKNQCSDGYFNSYIQTVGENRRFSDRDKHELYCAGHLIEAAISYHEATGKDKLLKCMIKYIDCIEKAFITESTAEFMTPGHQEIELALIKLYRYTGNKKYLDMAEFFLNKRANNNKDKVAEDSRYHQSDIPIRSIDEAIGHAVRAGYQYAAMAALCKENPDTELKNACNRIFENITNKKMSITGGIGATRNGEAFSYEYDLPNSNCYNETCASIALALFSEEMQQIHAKSVYGDIIEKVMYNGVISGMSLSGDKFFYENPLEIDPLKHKRPGEVLPAMERQKLFICSCCPPNLVRIIPSISRFMYTVDGNKIYCNQFASSETTIKLGEKEARIIQKTEYPMNGKISIRYYGDPAVIAVRVPGWFTGDIAKTDEGFAEFSVQDGSEIEVDFDMKPVFIEANPKVQDCSGRYAVMRGPIVYCMEGLDNGNNLRDVVIGDNFTEQYEEEFGAYILNTDAYRRKDTDVLYSVKSDDRIKFNAKMIPYYAFANRGASEMILWVMVNN